MPKQPRIFTSQETERLKTFEAAAKGLGLLPQNLMDIYDITCRRWQDIAYDCLNGMEEYGGSEKDYDSPNHMVAEFVFSCGIDPCLALPDWSQEDLRERTAFLERGGSHEWQHVEIAVVAAIASGWHYH